MLKTVSVNSPVAAQRSLVCEVGATACLSHLILVRSENLTFLCAQKPPDVLRPVSALVAEILHEAAMTGVLEPLKFSPGDLAFLGRMVVFIHAGSYTPPGEVLTAIAG